MAPSCVLVTAPCNACFTCFLIPAQCSSAPLFCELPSASMRMPNVWHHRACSWQRSAMQVSPRSCCSIYSWYTAFLLRVVLASMRVPIVWRQCTCCWQSRAAVKNIHVVGRQRGRSSKCMFHLVPVATSSNLLVMSCPYASRHVPVGHANFMSHLLQYNTAQANPAFWCHPVPQSCAEMHMASLRLGQTR